MKKMMKGMLVAVIMASLVLGFTACGGGGGNVSYPKIPTHPIYGDLPQLAAKWEAKDDALDEAKEKAIAKAKNINAYAKLAEKYEKLEEQADAEKEKDYADAIAKIKETGVPFEVRDGVGYSVTSVTVSSGSRGGGGFDISLQVTDKSKLSVSLMGVGTGLMNFLDSSGNVIQEGVEFYGLCGLANGDSKVINLGFSGYDIAKIVFTR